MPHLTHICKNSISTTQFSKIVFLPIPAELELGGTGRGEFPKIQSKLERPLIIEQGISLSFFCTFFLLQAPISLSPLSTSLLTGHSNWQTGGHEFNSSFLILSSNIRATHVKRGKRPSAAVNPTLPILLPTGSPRLLPTPPHALQILRESNPGCLANTTLVRAKLHCNPISSLQSAMLSP